MPLAVGELSNAKVDKVGYLNYVKYYGTGDFFEGKTRRRVRARQLQIR